MLLNQIMIRGIRCFVYNFACLFVFFAIVGCRHQPVDQISSTIISPHFVYRVSPTIQTSSNEFFVANLSAKCPNNGCEFFLLEIENKTDGDLELDWNKTLYILNGITSGGFMFEGIAYKDRNNSKLPDIIFAKSKFSKLIQPSSLVYFSRGRYGEWENKNMPTGENGVYLTVVVDGREIKEKITINITREQEQ